MEFNEMHECPHNETVGIGTTEIYKDDGQWYERVACGDAIQEINYCPFCGKKLD